MGLNLFRQMRAEKLVWMPDFSSKMVDKVGFGENNCFGTLSSDEILGGHQQNARGESGSS